MPRALKVFRTSAGFDDAYVAAPSRKAALAAWGADADLFARGVAEQVTDPALIAEPLQHPGVVIRRSRGDLAGHLQALPRRSAAARSPKPAAEPKPAKVKAPPKRDRIAAAEADLAKVRARQASEIAALEAQHDRERVRLERRAEAARAAYRKALAAWSR